MNLHAAGTGTVLTHLVLCSRPAPPTGCPFRFGSVDVPEGGRGQGGKHEGVVGHRLRDGLASRDPGSDHLKSVGGVQP